MKLSSYYQFKIKVVKSDFSDRLLTELLDKNGNELPDYKKNLTKTQWKKASIYLNRKLIPFCGYDYEVKSDYKKEGMIINII